VLHPAPSSLQLRGRHEGVPLGLDAGDDLLQLGQRVVGVEEEAGGGVSVDQVELGSVDDLLSQARRVLVDLVGLEVTQVLGRAGGSGGPRGGEHRPWQTEQCEGYVMCLVHHGPLY